MKKKLTIAMAAMTALLLCACAQQETTNTIATATPTVQTAAPAETTTPAEDGTRKAFQAALKTIHDDLFWPDLDGETGKIEIFEPSTIEWE